MLCQYFRRTQRHISWGGLKVSLAIPASSSSTHGLCVLVFSQMTTYIGCAFLISFMSPDGIIVTVQAQSSTHGTIGDTAVEQVRDTQAQVHQLEDRLKQAWPFPPDLSTPSGTLHTQLRILCPRSCVAAQGVGRCLLWSKAQHLQNRHQHPLQEGSGTICDLTRYARVIVGKSLSAAELLFIIAGVVNSKTAAIVPPHH